MNLEAIIQAMPDDLEIVVIGGIAAQRYIASYVTNDFDVCYNATPANWQHIITWFTPFTPSLWIAQQHRPLVWNTSTPMQDYTLMTQAGEIDLLQEVDGVGKYPQVKVLSVSAIIFGKTLWFLNLQGLITNKHAANRPKDLILLRQLEDEQRKGS